VCEAEGKNLLSPVLARHGGYDVSCADPE
jgi:hypothetical protein